MNNAWNALCMNIMKNILSFYFIYPFLMFSLSLILSHSVFHKCLCVCKSATVLVFFSLCFLHSFNLKFIEFHKYMPIWATMQSILHRWMQSSIWNFVVVVVDFVCKYIANGEKLLKISITIINCDYTTGQQWWWCWKSFLVYVYQFMNFEALNPWITYVTTKHRLCLLSLAHIITVWGVDVNITPNIFLSSILLVVL